ncbi:AI-2E family transporter [Winogradskyella sp.]|uniref:AI-2E family transporter n=1 Tax=Winogradskyella sp. TaxID=1883156 RepID=UPI0025E53292|nr:AI-2E family transporter [Winogradskyella sp.]
MMLKPIVDFFQDKLRNRIVSIFAAYLTFVLPLLALILFFINQSTALFSDLPSIRKRLFAIGDELLSMLSQYFSLDQEVSSNWFSTNFQSILDLSFGFVQESFQSGTTFIANAVLIIVITYFLLLYRTAFKNFLISQSKPKHRAALQHLFSQIQKLTKRYMIGQGIMVIILGTLIGLGLWAIGVPHPFFWGFLAGFLEIIPYIGTSIGGILPFTYMLMVSDTIWQPWAVVVLYIIIQQIEGNLISPNVMGSSIKVNPLFIIIGLFLGGIIWGISGLILALPILAISKEVFRSFDKLTAISYLMEDGLARKEALFLEQFDDSKYHFLSLFFKEK